LESNPDTVSDDVVWNWPSGKPHGPAATDANRTQTQSRELDEGFSEDAQNADPEAVIWLPPRDSNPDMLIQSQISPTENKENRDLRSAKRDQTRQNTHTGRTRKGEAQS